MQSNPNNIPQLCLRIAIALLFFVMIAGADRLLSSSEKESLHFYKISTLILCLIFIGSSNFPKPKDPEP